MNTIKLFGLFLLFSIFSKPASAQDAVVIDTGNFVRGTIKGTDNVSVFLIKDDETVVEYKAKDVKEFLWNGDTYVSKPVVYKKKMEFRFLKVIELGAVNLYALGRSPDADQAPQERVRVRPSVGIGMGTGGFGGGGVGLGVGGEIAIGGGRRRDEGEGKVSHAIYYIERPGTGPLRVIAFDGRTYDTNLTKSILLQKLTDDEDLAERIKSTESFDAKSIKAFVSAYNAMHK